MFKVAILGASSRPERYSYKCLKMLEQYGYDPVLVHPTQKKIEGHKVYSDLITAGQTEGKIHTVSVYVNKGISSKMVEQIIQQKPQRVIFNPGTENPELYPTLQDQGIEVTQACTLVLLSTDQFE